MEIFDNIVKRHYLDSTDQRVYIRAQLQGKLSASNLIGVFLITLLAISFNSPTAIKGLCLVPIIMYIAFRVKSYLWYEGFVDFFAPQVDEQNMKFSKIGILLFASETSMFIPALFFASTTSKSHAVDAALLFVLALLMASILGGMCVRNLKSSIQEASYINHRPVSIKTASGEVIELDSSETGIYFMDGDWLVYKFNDSNREYKYYRASDVTVTFRDGIEVTPENYKRFVR